MTTTGFVELIEQEIPRSLAMPDDPVGLQVMAADLPLSVVAVAYELNERIVEEAADLGAGLIVAFHPLIYPHLKSLTGSTRVERTVIGLVDRRIALYVLHTAFDAHPQGTSRLLADCLGCAGVRPLVPNPVHDGAGMGAIGDLAEPIDLPSFAELVRATCGTEVVRFSAPAGADAAVKTIRRVAILGGSGMSFYDAAVAAGADVFVTADARYHAFHAANDGIPIVDPGHAESEAFVVEGMRRLIERTLERAGRTVEVVAVNASTNPVRYIF